MDEYLNVDMFWTGTCMIYLYYDIQNKIFILNVINLSHSHGTSLVGIEQRAYGLALHFSEG